MMSGIKLIVFICASALPLCVIAAKDVSGSADHALISRYPESNIITYVASDYDEYQLPLGSNKSSKGTEFEKSLKLAGSITRIGYALKKETSTLKIHENFASAAKKAGFKILFECSGTACGNSSGWQHFFTNSQVWGKKESQRLLVSSKQINQRDVYLVIFTGEQSSRLTYQIDVIETRQMQKNLVEINADNLQQKLRDEGKVALYGIHFDVDKATLLPDSAQNLQVIADVLDRDKSLRVYIVGHTDDSGKLDHNITLSEQRAKAVVKALIDQFKIDSARLTSFGAGPYAPVGNNANEDGRQQNRRVEIIKRL